MRRRWLCLLSLAPAATAQPVTLRICANQTLDASDKGSSAYRLARLALASMPDLRAEFTPLPWQRCLSEAAAGRYDAVLSASHTPERARSLHYPLDAAGQPDAAWRMFQIGYVLFKRKDAAVQWDGQRFKGSSTRAGEAIGAERGYSIVQFARDRGAVVEDRYPQFASLVDSLRLRRIAAMLINQESAELLLADPAWSQDFEISGASLQHRAYFMPFSPAFAAAQPQRVRQIWQALVQVRQTPAFQLQYSLSLSGGRRRDLRP